MHAWEAIQTAVDTIEEHIAEEISILELAGKVGLSPFYFQRLFRRLVHKPVNEYIKLRRLARASEPLGDKSRKIADIAQDFGFFDHAAFTRAFKAAYGLTPEEYRASSMKLTQFVKPELLLQYVMVEENVPLITEGMVLEITRRTLDKPRTFLGIAGEIPINQLYGGETTGMDQGWALWERFHQQKAQIPHLLPGGNEFGALYMGDAAQGCCIYMAGAEAEDGATAKEYTAFTLPAGEYLVCGFEAESLPELVGAALYKADQFTGRWMQARGLTTTAFAAELYYPPTPDAAYLEHWVIPVPVAEP